MTESTVALNSRVGLHARPAAVFVQEGLKHKCKIQVESQGRKADGKSIVQILALGVKCGQVITIRAEGPGEEEAVAALVNVVNSTTA